MAGVSKASELFFRLSPAILNDEPYMCFSVKRGEVSEKLEVNYWLPEYRENAVRIERSQYPVFNLGDLTIGQPGGLKDGPGGWLINKSEYVDDGIPIIRATNVKEDGLDLNDVVYISYNKHKALHSSETKAGDLLLTMRGTIGRSCIVPDYISMANMNAAVCRIRLQDQCLNEFIRDFLNSDSGRAS